MNKTKSWFFEKVNKIDKSLARLLKKKREKNQINKIRSKKEVTIDNTETQRIIGDYYEQLYGNNGEGNGTPIQYSCLDNPMDGRAWWAAVHGVARSQTRLSD